MYAAMLPRLQAREQLDGVSVGAASAGTMKNHDRSEFLAALKKQAQRPQLAKKATAADLQALGLTK